MATRDLLPRPKRSNSVEIETPEGSIVEQELTTSDSPVDEEHVTQDHREGLVKVLTKAIGLDITAIALPVTLNEPASFLMRLVEQFQYTELLDKAAQCEDSCQRLMFVGIFAASVFAVQERTGKPFNPLLGETFEYIDEKRNNLKFIAEQVSHHPPIGSIHAENDNFILWQTQQLKTKFTGNSLECYVIGSTNVTLKTTGDQFRWEGIKTTVHNVIVGKLWLDHHGDMEIFNQTTSEKAKIGFTKCGWFSKGWHEVAGTVYDMNGTAAVQIFGKWNEAIYGKLLNGYTPAPNREIDNGGRTSPTDDAKNPKQEKRERKKDAREFKKQLKLNPEEPLWVHTNKALDPTKLPCKYMTDWTQHTLEVIALRDNQASVLPPTDSRLRADRAALEKEEVKKAASAKHQLEEKQRQEERARRTPWVPRYFKKVSEDLSEFAFKGNYWNEREERLSSSK
jgi:hypothetical protein